jgi:hypothetical protein
LRWIKFPSGSALSLKPGSGTVVARQYCNRDGFTMRAAAVLLFALFVFAAPARAGDDVAAAQSVIRAQEQAFARDDAASAYSYAAPVIQQRFPGPEIFMTMVQGAYAPVYRHRNFEFGEARTEGNWVAQRVHIIDANGEAWEALYTLEQQADGSYKITGCTLLKAGEAV